MRRDITEKIELGDVEADISEKEIKLKKGGKEISRKYEGFEISKEGNSLILEMKSSTKNEKKQIKTLKAHLINAINGFDKKYVYKLQVCAVHFPMNIAVDKAKKELVIKNFLGEVKPRIAKILHDVEVKVDKEIITVEGHDKERTGQTAANIERATKITGRDRRTFQDGIHLIDHPDKN